MADMPAQLKKIEGKEYDYILLQIGGNDMVQLHTVKTVTAEFKKVLESLPKRKKLIVTSCGNLGGARIFPRLIGMYYEKVSRNYHSRFRTLVQKYNGIYIDLFEKHSVDPFVIEPDKYLAKDYFHPSSVGYAYWFKKVVESME